MISKFNKQVIEEVKKLNTNKFDDAFYSYKKLLEQEAPPAEAPPTDAAPPPTDAAPADAASATPDATEPEQDIPMEKSYTDLLIIIAKALKVNLLGDATEGTSNFNSYKRLKEFAETWIAQEGKAEQIKDSQAVAEIDKIQQNLNNILGSAEQAE